MTFILSRDLPDPDSLVYFKKRSEAWTKYRAHLGSCKRLPPKALEFARADWHYDIRDPRCPHDASLELLRIEEGPAAASVYARSTQIAVDLLGAYRDGHLQIVYTGVTACSFDLPLPDMFDGRLQRRSHERWLIDEVRSPGHKGRAVHEIEWSSGAHWIIDCREIEAHWVPITASHA